MSVSGLDTVEVESAYQAALASSQSAAWIILSYMSREGLGLFSNGSGDLQSFQTSIAAYKDQSPLYGFLCHERRKYVIRYVPRGTSRLLQARTAVHLQSVADRFSPDDTPLTVNELHELGNVISSGQSSNANDDLINNELKPQPTSSRNLNQSAVQSSNAEVANILSRLRAIKEGRFRSNTPDKEGDPRRVQGDGLQLQCSRDGDVSLPPREILSSRRSTVSKGSVEAVEAAEAACDDRSRSQVDNWQGYEDLDGSSSPTWRPKVKHFARPVTDDQVNKSRSASGVRQRLPSGIRIGSKKYRVSPAADGVAARGLPHSAKEMFDKSGEITVSVTAGPATRTPHLSRKHSDRWSVSPASAQPSKNALHVREPHRENRMPAQIWPAFEQTQSPTLQPLTLERQRLMRALAMRNKRLEWSARSRHENEIRRSSASGGHSNADSAIEVDHYDDSESDQEVPDPTTARLRRRGSRVNLLLPTASSTQSEDQRDGTQNPRGAFSRTAARAHVSQAPGSCVPFPPNGRTNEEDGYESSSSSDALIEELQTAIVEEARRVSLPSSPAIRTGSADDGTPSPYSITSVVILPGSNRSHASSPNSEGCATRSPTPKSSVAGEAIMKLNRHSFPVIDEMHSTKASEHSSNECTVPIINPTPSPSSLALWRKSGQRLLDKAAQPFHSGAPRVNYPVDDIAQPSSPDVASEERFVRRDGLSRIHASTVNDEQHPAPSPNSLHPANQKGQRPLSLNLASGSPNRLSATTLGRRSMDIGILFGRSPNEVKPATALGRDLNFAGNSDARSTRAARIMKRLSSGFSASSRQPLAQVQEQPAVEAITTDFSTAFIPAPIPSAIGELNVQFPDSLLWKRRWVEVDAQGSLVMGGTKVQEWATNTPKIYPFSAFRAPFIPSHDRQEMPCSVLLDLVHGGTLQFACGDSAGQAQVMTWLSSTYNYCVL